MCRTGPRFHQQGAGVSTELLKPFGLDARDPGFWSLGLSMIERLIGELAETQPN